jgi:hypothetical protein
MIHENTVEVKPHISQSKESLSIEPDTKKSHQRLIIKGKSINHNFQKHTVVTIKKLTKNIAFRFDNGNIETLAHQMWNVFLTCGVKSKQILVILFGEANIEDEKYREILKRCYFGELCSYWQQSIRSAQNLLRSKVSTLLSEERVRKNI